MKLSTLMVINSVIAFIFGILFVLIPWQVVMMYGIQPDPAVNYMSQLFGTCLLMIAILSWMAKNAGESDVRKAILMSFFIGDVIGFIISLIAQLNHVVNNLGWSTVVLYLLLGIGFGYFSFSKSSS
jgi:uncharacterized membrane protein YqgA involved in biofilm formation